MQLRGAEMLLREMQQQLGEVRACCAARCCASAYYSVLLSMLSPHGVRLSCGACCIMLRAQLAEADATKAKLLHEMSEQARQ